MMRVEEDVPAIPTQEAANVDAQSAQASGRQDKGPASHAVPDARRHFMNEVQGKKSNRQSEQSEEKDHHEIDPEEPTRMAVYMDQVREDVGCIREENKPAKRTGEELPVAGAADLMPVAQGDGEEQGHPGKEQIPNQEKVPQLFGGHTPNAQQPSGDNRRKQQARDWEKSTRLDMKLRKGVHRLIVGQGQLQLLLFRLSFAGFPL